jgi:uncharacterized protein (TIGR02246 family)
MRSFKLILIASVVFAFGSGALATEDHSQHTQKSEHKAKQKADHQMHAMHDDHLSMMRELKDRQEIEELMWRYARTLDTLDAEGYVALYTEDGQFASSRENAIKGRDALKNFVLGVKKSREEREAKGEKPTGTLHMTTNHIITFQDKDHARIDSYWLTIFPGRGTEILVRVGGAGRSVDELVRVNGKWLIKSRNVGPQD